MSWDRPRSVPVVPNVAVVRGNFIGTEPSLDGDGSTWKIAVEESRDVEGMPNFVHPQVGKTIQVFVGSKHPLDFGVNDALEARVAYRGDERGGRFVLMGSDIRKL